MRKPEMTAPTMALTGAEPETETAGTESDPLQDFDSRSDPPHSSAAQDRVRMSDPSALPSQSPFHSVQGPHPSQSISSKDDPAGQAGPTDSPLRTPPDARQTRLRRFLLYRSHGVQVDQQPQSPEHGWVLQARWAIVDDPMQAGSEMPQDLTLIWYPPPHSLEHLDHSVQSSSWISWEVATVVTEHWPSLRQNRSSEETFPAKVLTAAALEPGTL